MTQVSPSAKPALGSFGVFGHHQQWQRLAPERLRDIEALGYGAIWAGGSPAAELDWVDPILGATETLQLATGIVNIWTADAGPVAQSFHRIEEAYPGRFLLGIGVGHPEAHQEYRKPYDALVDAVVAHGTVAAIAARLAEHLAAGADHVPVQVLTGSDNLVPALAELAGPLGIQ